MPNQKPVRLEPRDFESLGEKLQHLHSTLSPGEARVFEFLLKRAVTAAGNKAPPPLVNKVRSKPHGSKRALVRGGADGRTVLVNRYGQFYVIEPEGPFPTELPAHILGAISISGI